MHSVTLLTCDSAPNRIAAPIHDRMPVILADRDAQQAWLDPALGAEEALAVCGALATERLSARAANPAVNKAGRRGGAGAAVRAWHCKCNIWGREARALRRQRPTRSASAAGSRRRSSGRRRRP